VQGVALGGEWAGAVLISVEHGDQAKRGRNASFTQVGPSFGTLLATGSIGLITFLVSPDDFLAWGWRIPFLASAVLVLVGLYVRLTITETPVFAASLGRGERVEVPMLVVFRDHSRTLVVGTLVALATFVIFYLMTVFTLSWGTSALGDTREEFLWIQLVGVACFAVTIPVAAVIAERGRRRVLMASTIAIGLFGLVMGPLFLAGTLGAVLTVSIGLGLMGLTYGPLGTVLSELFPTAVRYTGSSLTFNLAGIFGASLAPYIATWLANNYGVQYVGYYLTAAAVLTMGGLLMTRETRDEELV
jgi:MFS family permease